MDKGLSKKQITKLISKVQRGGVRDGDLCPRCGLPSLRQKGSGYVENLKAYICPECYLEYVLLMDKEDDMSSWNLYQENVSPLSAKTITREILPIYKEGDRVIDTRSDWPGTITHALPQGGLYEVLPDGSDEVTVLKDKDIIVESDEDMEQYLQFLSSHFFSGMTLEIVQITSSIGDTHQEMVGTVQGVLQDGGVAIRFTSDDSAVIYPDVDRVRYLGEIQQAAETTGQLDDNFSEFEIEF